MNLPRSYDILATFGEFEKQALQVQFLFPSSLFPCYLGRGGLNVEVFLHLNGVWTWLLGG